MVAVADLAREGTPPEEALPAAATDGAGLPLPALPPVPQVQALSLERPALLAPTHPLWQCGLRPFFLATVAVAWLAMAAWAGAWLLGSALPPAAADVGFVAWHGHALLAAAGLAATTGFVLTAVPEFTASPGFAPRTVQRLALLWTAATLLALLPGPLAQGLAGLGWVALLLGLLAQVAPRLWRAAGATAASCRPWRC